MEHAGRSLTKLKLPGGISSADLACASWLPAVGKRLAARTAAVALVRDKLVVEVEDAIWQRQLFGMRDQILNRLREITGSAVIGDIEFRIGVPRRPPQKAQSLAATADDADRIEDAVLRHVYKEARRKATR